MNAITSQATRNTIGLSTVQADNESFKVQYYWLFVRSGWPPLDSPHKGTVNVEISKSWRLHVTLQVYRQNGGAIRGSRPCAICVRHIGIYGNRHILRPVSWSHAHPGRLSTGRAPNARDSSERVACCVIYFFHHDAWSRGRYIFSWRTYDVLRGSTNNSSYHCCCLLYSSAVSFAHN